MFDGLFIISFIGTCVQAIKDSFERTIPAENWGNKELYQQDMANGVSIEQRMKNLENGKYILKEKYPEPHRDKNGKIIIENCLLYNQDLERYGAYQVYKWAEQGRYNLEGEALKKENERIKKKYEYLYNL